MLTIDTHGDVRPCPCHGNCVRDLLTSDRPTGVTLASGDHAVILPGHTHVPDMTVTVMVTTGPDAGQTISLVSLYSLALRP